MVNPVLLHDKTFGISFEVESKEADEKSGFKLPSGNLIEFLSNDPEISACYAKDAGVSEGYTVGQHTQMVLDTAAKYKRTFEQQVSKVASWEEFLLFLALHDIGKGLAKDKQSVFDSSISFKSSELTHTQDLMRKNMGKHGVAPEKIAIFCEMLSFDTQGLFLKGDIGEGEAFDNILEMSRNCGLDPTLFYGIFSAYHAIDAASYPGLFQTIFEVHEGRLHSIPSHQKEIEKLTKRLKQVVEGRKCFTKLQQKLYAGEVEASKDYFLQSLPQLTQFLMSMHKEMLALTVNPEAALKAQQKFREIRLTFRDFFVAVAETSPHLEKIKQKYPLALEKELGRRDIGTRHGRDLFVPAFAEIFFPVGSSWHQPYDLVYFLDELTHFRRNYLCRYSMHKVWYVAVQYMLRSANQEEIKKHLDFSGKLIQPQDFTSLMQSTFIHGTNAAIMPNLVRTGMSLVCSGRLAKAKIVLFSGELLGGATAAGYNRHSLSGTTLDDAQWSISYSKRYLPKPSTDESVISGFLKKEEERNPNQEIFRDCFNTTIGGYLVSANSAILRWRSNNSSSFESVRPRLEKAVGRLDDSFKKYKLSKDYKNHMPQKLDPKRDLGYRWHDDYWYLHFQNCEEGIKGLKQALTDEVAPIKGMQEAIQNPYPLVFVSKTLHTRNPKLDLCSERLCPKAAPIGKEIQMIYTKPENREHAVQFFNSHVLEGRVTYGDIADIEQVRIMNWLISPYLADFASSRKIARLEQTVLYFV